MPLLSSVPSSSRRLFFLGGALLVALLTLLLVLRQSSFLQTRVTPPSVPSASRAPVPPPASLPHPPLPQTLPTRGELELLTNDLRALQRGNAHAHLTERAQYRTRRLAQAASTFNDSLVQGLLLSDEELAQFPPDVRPLLEIPHTTLEGTVGEGVIDGVRPEDSRDLFLLHVEPTHELVLLVGSTLTSPGIPNAHVTVTGTKVGTVLLVEGGFQNIRAPSPAPTSTSSLIHPNPLSTLLRQLITAAEAYNLSGYAWPNPNITASYMPDGTDMLWGYTSSLFAELNPVAPTATWQREFARALQTWAEYANINFHFVPDDGSQWAIWGLGQGDPRFGDIRLGARPGGGAASSGYPTAKTYDGTDAGDITLNSDVTFHIGSYPDLYSVLLHEGGHSLGLMHSFSGTVMYGTITGTYSGLTGDDIAGIQAISGARLPDVFDAGPGNDSLSSASALTLDSLGHIVISADLTSRADLDYYRVVAPATFDGTLSVSVDARGKSLLAPKVTVSTTTGTVLGTVNAPTYGSLATLSLTGLSPSQSVVLTADGATSDVFGMGAYLLTVQFGGVTSILPPPSALTATASALPQVSLSWTDNATNETGYQVERSLDTGSTWSVLQSLAANTTSTQDSSVVAGTTYAYRIRAVEGTTLSDPSNTATVTLVPAVPPSLTATALSPTQITLTWGDVQGETGYTLDRTLDGTTWIQIGAVSANTTTYQDSGLSPSTTYTYRVKAYNQGGSSPPSTTASATTLPSSSPSPTISPTPTPSPSASPSPSPSPSPLPSPSPTVSPDTTKPTVSITDVAPKLGGSVTTGITVSRNATVTIQASASDNVGVSSVQFLVNGRAPVTCPTPDTTSPYTCSWKVPNAKNKLYTLTATATDTSGNQGTSAPVSVTGR